MGVCEQNSERGFVKAGGRGLFENPGGKRRPVSLPGPGNPWFVRSGAGEIRGVRVAGTDLKVSSAESRPSATVDDERLRPACLMILPIPACPCTKAPWW